MADLTPERLEELGRLIEAKKTAGIPGTPRETFLYVARDNLRDALEADATALLTAARERETLRVAVGAATAFMNIAEQGDKDTITTLRAEVAALSSERDRLIERNAELVQSEVRLAEDVEAVEAERDALREALRDVLADLDLRAEIHAKLHGEEDVVVPVSGSILDRARTALPTPTPPTTTREESPS